MSEPVITCPSCRAEIRLTESLAAPLIESTRQRFVAQLAEKDREVAEKERAMRDREQTLEVPVIFCGLVAPLALVSGAAHQ